MYTLDASVWANGFDRKEPGAQISHRLLRLPADRGAQIIIPNLALVEIADR